MGEPVRIIDLARNMIRLSGKEPETEIPIVEIGARPGEKLNEELWTADEAVGQTTHPKIMRASRPPIDVRWLEQRLERLERLVAAGDTLEVVSTLTEMVRSPKREQLPPQPFAATETPAASPALDPLDAPAAD
jgi:FlaA1/EpsC-like NDP-sugar epimerase